MDLSTDIQNVVLLVVKFIFYFAYGCLSSSYLMSFYPITSRFRGGRIDVPINISVLDS
jgi:hypothetical protein